MCSDANGTYPCPSCPDSIRASICKACTGLRWIAGSSPAMTRESSECRHCTSAGRTWRRDSVSERKLYSRRQLQPARDFRHALGDVRLQLRLGVVHGGDDQVLEHLDLLAVDQRRIDLQPADVALAGKRHLYHAAAGRSDQLGRGQLLLEFPHLLLQLLRLLHHLAEVLHHRQDLLASLPPAHAVTSSL